MKGIFKLMTAAVAVGALASCSDELDVQKAAVQARQQADLIGTLPTVANTRIGIEETDWDNGRLADFELRWTEGDQVRVFKLDNMTYNTYELDPATAGTSTGAFTKKNDFLTDLNGKMYAMTEGQFVYAISPNAEGKPLLTMSIPNSYDLDEEYLELTGVNKFPAPYWGETTTDQTGTDADGNPTYQVTAPFKGLTSFLRLDLRTLPVGTKAIVLTTHGSQTSPRPTSTEAEGFQLATKAQMVAGGYATATDKLITRDNYLKWYNDGANFVTGGQSEPLSGTLSCVLEDGAALAYSDKLVSRDTIRINLQDIPEIVGTGITDLGTGEELTTTENEDKVIYVPIVAGLYKDLHVIAVTEDSPFSYQWVGEEIEKYTDEVFKVNTIKQLIMKLNVDVDDCLDWEDLSEAIYEATLENPGRTLNVDIPADVVTNTEDNVLYIDNTQTHNDLVLNWPAGADVTERLKVVEAVPEYDAAREVVKRWLGVSEDPASAERYITLNLDNACAKEYNFSTPTSIVTIGTTNGFNNTTATVKVIAAAKNEMVPSSTLNDPTIYPGVSGHDLVESGGSELMNRKNATVFVKNGIGALEIMPKSVGAVYIYSGGFEETEIFNYYAIRSDKAILTRLTDALVYNVWPLETENTKRYLFTTGSSAIGMIKPLASADATITPVAPYDAATANLTAGGEVKDADKPSNFHVVAYWTGAALQPAAIGRYDKAFVYTAAQLASAGEETTADYAIPAGVVTEMWLGGNYFPWIGAEADVANFKFNGMNVSLQNMELEIGDASFTDPHHCCTSCGELRKINLTENLGLFRSIINTTSAEVDNINLNDVLLITEEPIDNIGAIAGLIQSPQVILRKNQVGEVKIDVNGTNIGGMVGKMEGAQLAMYNNQVTNKDDDKTVGYIISDKDNVGGQIGYAKVTNALIENSSVSLKDQITAGSRNIGTKKVPVLVSRVGGIVGLLEAANNAYFTKPNVYVKNKISGAEQQVGGIGGYIDANNIVKVTDGKVETALIESENGGFVGGAAGQLDDKDAVVTGNEVKATQILADDDNVGGVAGRLNDNGNKADFSKNSVESDKIFTPKQNAAGLIGFSNMPTSNAEMAIDSTAITVKELEATEGFAGGEIGSQHKGIVKIGKVDATNRLLANNVTINKISGKFALGGLVGGNNDKTYVYSNHKGNPITGQSKIALNIADWSNTFASDTEENTYFNTDNESDHRSGTVGNFVGYLDGALYVQEVAGDLTVTDKLTSAKKKELGFWNHKNRKYTIDEYAYYWGDTNGYVGWGHSGTYSISTENDADPAFTAVNADQTGNYNLYKPESVYDGTKSKWE